jgi:hypothetical protein
MNVVTSGMMAGVLMCVELTRLVIYFLLYGNVMEMY